jgi:hypothetical protein
MITTITMEAAIIITTDIITTITAMAQGQAMDMITIITKINTIIKEAIVKISFYFRLQ